ncbi:MAG TPA: hypothetical protein VF794_10505 [Archangium sp.]|jgi:hypothetical protein|uniref:hypothetical protein n=1 Tax=Archangium sp. TaxID=1872627 RepID=UPI002ED8E72F
MAENVRPIAPKTPETIKEAVDWVRAMHQRGLYKERHSRDIVCAIETLARVLDSTEPREAQWFLENVAGITHRWTVKENANTNTAKKHREKAQAGLRAFLAYRRDPDHFGSRPRAKLAGSRKPKVQAKAPSVPHKVVAAAPSQTVSSKSSSTGDAAGLRNTSGVLALSGQDRRCEFSVPDDLNMRDVGRIFCHLMTHARDFDPTNPSHGRPFGITSMVDSVQT